MSAWQTPMPWSEAVLACRPCTAARQCSMQILQGAHAAVDNRRCLELVVVFDMMRSQVTS